jgi:flagella basal body P-ring formation protein FlgA
MKFNFHLSLKYFASLLIFFPLNLQANSQSLDALYQQVESYIKQNLDQNLQEVQVNVRPLSSALNLPNCQQPVTLSHRQTQPWPTRLTVQVECTQPTWRIFISSDIQGKLPVVLAAKGIVRQAVITSDDVELKLIPIQQLRRGAMRDTQDVIGMRAKRVISPQQIIQIGLLDIPYWVNEGQEVTLISRAGGIEIRSIGTSLADGMHQDWVEVQNKSSGIVIKGIVIAKNTVWVP